MTHILRAEKLVRLEAAILP